jgi:uncharacterized protein YkwD
MIKKLSMLALSLALLLSACNGQAPAETEAPAPTVEQPPAVTEAPGEIPVTGVTESLETPADAAEITATPPPPRPTNEPGCTNSAAFVIDVTIPDNSVIGAGETFTKTWRVRNTGTCIWASDYVLTHYSENSMGAPDSTPLDITFPGETLDISVNLIAPATPGTYRGNFVIENPEGLIMQVDNDSRLWLIIQVQNTAPTATAGTTTTNASPTGSASAAATSSGTGSGGATCSFSTDVFKLTAAIEALNSYRSQNGLPNFTVNTLLVRAAQAHANDMACNNFFTHTGSDGSTPQTRVAAQGYTASSVSENVYGSNPPLDGPGVINWWRTDTGDPRHGQNLLSTAFTEIGVGYSFFDDTGYYVLVLARP